MRSRNTTIKTIGLMLSLLLALPAQTLAISVEPLEHPNDYPNGRAQEPRAGFWRTYALTSGGGVALPPPPHKTGQQTSAELAELRTLQQQRTPEIQARIDFWNAEPAFKPWTETQLDLIRNQGVNPPRAHRGLALVHAAIYDAVVAAWFWKYIYHRPPPSRLDHSLSPSVEPPNHPTYPSEHAAIAGAAARMLGYLFPADAAALKAKAMEAALSRLQAGVNYRSDIEAGFELGGAVAELMISRRAMNDGSFATWDCVAQPGRLTGPGFWEPASAPFDLCPPAGRLPTEPLAGEWRTWVIPSTDRFLAEPPPGFNLYGTNQADVCNLLEQPARELMDHVAATRAELPGGPRNELIARWAGPPGIRWNLITLELLARDELNLPRAARVSALVNVALADSIQASWKSKYKYWVARPQTIIRQCRFDEGFASVRPSPRDPAYTSGNSTCGGVAAEILSYFFPDDTDSLREEAEGGGISRLYDGTHWSFDIDVSLAMGRRMAPLFIERAKRDGAHPTR